MCVLDWQRVWLSASAFLLMAAVPLMVMAGTISQDEDVSDSIVTLNADDPLLDKLFGAMPHEGDNEQGHVAMNAIVRQIEGSIPGICWFYDFNWALDYCQFTNQPFTTVLVPSYSRAPHQDQVDQYMGLSHEWWANYSIALISKHMYDKTSTVRPQLDIPRIRNDIDDKNRRLVPNLDYIDTKSVTWEFYAYVFSQENTQFKEAFDSIASDPDKLRMYQDKYLHEGLLSEAWITAKKAQSSEGSWRNPGPAWEMYHHCIKLYLLGTDVYLIGAMLGRLIDIEQMILPKEIYPRYWQYYTGWLNLETVEQQVNSDSHNGIVAWSDCEVVFPLWKQCCKDEPEYHSKQFIRNDPYRGTGPGIKYVI